MTISYSKIGGSAKLRIQIGRVKLNRAQWPALTASIPGLRVVVFVSQQMIREEMRSNEFILESSKTLANLPHPCRTSIETPRLTQLPQ